MKIAMVVPGGVDRSAEYRIIPVLLALIERLAARHELHVFALNQEPAPATWELLGARIHNVGDGATRWRAVKMIRAEHRRAPFHLVQAIWSGSSGWVAMWAAGILRIPGFVHIAGGELVALPDIQYGGRLHWQGRVREALTLRRAAAITAASAYIIDSVSRLGLQARRLPLGIDLNRWPPRAPLHRQAQSPARLIHVASLNRVKDQTTLLRACAALAQAGVSFHLDVVGEDTLNGAVQHLAKTLGVAHSTSFHGFLTQAQLRPLLEQADVLMVSSRHEAGPVVMLEAAALGVPTVGTAVGHMVEWAPAAALSVPVGAWSEMADAVKALLQDEALRLRLGNAAMQRALREDVDFTAAQLEALYEACWWWRLASHDLHVPASNAARTT